MLVGNLLSWFGDCGCGTVVEMGVEAGPVSSVHVKNSANFVSLTIVLQRQYMLSGIALSK